jgi:ABC-type multidrug transport system fused ATPase/permease subunit
VRAFAAEDYFMEQMQTITAITSAQWWAICTMEVWISFRSQVISGIAVFVATCLALSGTVSPGSAGMVIASSNLVTTYVYWLTLDYKHLSNNSNSIERVKEYIEVEQEAPEKVEGHPVPAAWPSSEGGIQVKNLSVRYDKDLPEVLHSISFDVKKREKVRLIYS